MAGGQENQRALRTRLHVESAHISVEWQLCELFGMRVGQLGDMQYGTASVFHVQRLH